MDAEARSSANVGALQDGQCPPSGTAPPQCGQLTGYTPGRDTVGPRKLQEINGEPTPPPEGRQYCHGPTAESVQATSRTRTDVPTWIWSPGARNASLTARPLTKTCPLRLRRWRRQADRSTSGTSDACSRRHALVVDQDRTSGGIAAETRLAEEVERAAQRGPGHATQAPGTWRRGPPSPADRGGRDHRLQRRLHHHGAAEHASAELAGGAEAARLEDVGHHQEEGAALDGDAEQRRFAHEGVVEAVEQGGEGEPEQEEHEAVPPLGDRRGR